MTLQQDAQNWTIRDLMKFSINYLQRHGFDEARLTVELLLSHALQCQRIELYTNFEKPLSKQELKNFRGYFERRLSHEPVQYIVGMTSFMGLQFAVDTRVFIPRPETETLVEQVMMLCGRREPGEVVSLLDVGTGSGNIAVSLAKLVRNLRVTSIDVSQDALEVARRNAAAHGVQEQLTFEGLDVFSEIEKRFAVSFEIVVSNPPYVSADEWTKLEPDVREFEPERAVSDRDDGYRFYRRLAQICPRLLRPDGMLVVEVGHEQSEEVKRLFGASGYSDLQVVNDLQGIPRVVSARWRGERLN
jgi:release factor glutamine methyltransferase